MTYLIFGYPSYPPFFKKIHEKYCNLLYDELQYSFTKSKHNYECDYDDSDDIIIHILQYSGFCHDTWGGKPNAGKIARFVQDSVIYEQLSKHKICDDIVNIIDGYIGPQLLQF